MNAKQDTRLSLVTEFANKYHVAPEKMMTTLRETCFKQDAKKPPATDAQMMALMVVANEHNLNPFTKEIYAFPQGDGIVPIVSIDGWLRIINSHPQFDGMEFDDDFLDGKLHSITCRMFRADRKHPIQVTEYMAECERGTEPWKKWPARMLRHKATIQAARYAFGFSGIYDPDEGERMRDVTSQSTVTRVSQYDEGQTIEENGNVIDTETGEVLKTTAPHVEGSPAFVSLHNKLNAASSTDEIDAILKSPMYGKMTAKERERFNVAADIKKDSFVS